MTMAKRRGHRRRVGKRGYKKCIISKMRGMKFRTPKAARKAFSRASKKCRKVLKVGKVRRKAHKRRRKAHKRRRKAHKRVRRRCLKRARKARRGHRRCIKRAKR